MPHFLCEVDPDPLRSILTYNQIGAVGTWAAGALPPGQALREPAPLLKKPDERVIEEEYGRLG